MAQSALKTQHTSAQKEEAVPRFRRDIQGLRALAVLAVIADHLFGFPSGGFIGVDVFFVISGFIITSLLLRQHQKTGTVSFVDFYRRRIKRILPASVLVLLVTVFASYLIFRAGRATSILTDAAWSLLFAGNWRFAVTGTDYWSADGTSPLQHYWSLGVEEQFYFVWPVLILLAFMFAPGSREGQGRRLLGTVLVVLTAGSFAWAMFETATNPSWAYFSTFSRAWELGIGALLAVGAGVLRRIPEALRPILAWGGLIGIAVSLFTVNSASQVPAPGVGLPVIFTAIVISAGTGGQQRFIAPLTNRVSSYVGDISYSLYLWHFPVIVLLPEVLPFGGIIGQLAALVVIAAVSAASYHFIEDPIRSSAWLESKHHRRRNRELPMRLKVTSIAILALAAVSVSAYALTRNQVETVAAPRPVAAADKTLSNADKLGAALTASAEAKAWPDLNPSLDSIDTAGKPDEDAQGCGATDFTDPGSCNFPSNGATKTAVVYGDSTGITLLPTVRAALGSQYNVRGFTHANCVLLDIQTKLSQKDADACAAHRANSIAEINRTKPSVVFIIQNYGWINSWVTNLPDNQRGDVWQAKTEDLLTQLAPSGSKIVFVDPSPEGKPFSQCATRTSSPSDCTTMPTPGYHNAAYAITQAAGKHGAFHINSLAWFCTKDDVCPSFSGSTPIKRDNIHTTKQYAAQLVPAFKDELSKILT